MINERGFQTYTNKEKKSYLISLSGQNILFQIVATVLAFYLQFTIAIPALIVSIIISVARFWDAFNDFIMGNLIDRTKTKWGKCKPYLMIVPVPLALFTALCFTNFGIYGDGSSTKDVFIVLWAAFTYISFGMVYTVGDIPIWGITALMTEDEQDRVKLISIARIVGTLAGAVVLLSMQSISLQISSILNTANRTAMEAEKLGFFITALGFAILGGALFQIGSFFIKEKVPQTNKDSYSLKEGFKIMFSNKPFRQIITSGILGSPKMLILTMAIPLTTYYYASKDPGQQFVFMALLGGSAFFGAAMSFATAPLLLKKFTRKKSHNMTSALGAIPFALIIVVYLASPRGSLASNVPLIALQVILFMLAGLSYGYSTVFQTTLVADCIDYEELKNGKRTDGLFFAGITFLAKLNTGIATILSGIAYSAVGFSGENVKALNSYIEDLGNGLQTLAPRLVDEYQPYMFILFFLISIPPAIGCLLALIPMKNYSLDDKEYDLVQAKLKIQRKTMEDNGQLSHFGN